MSMVIDSFRFGAAAPVSGWVSSTTQGFMSNVTNHVVTLPTGRVSGDIMVATLVDVGGSQGWATPSGWTLAATQSGAAGLDIALSLYYRVTDAAEGATVTFVNNGSSRWVGTCDLYRGFASVTAHPDGDAISGFDASDTIAEWTGSPGSMDSGDLLVSVFGVATSSGEPTGMDDVFTEPSGTTVRTNYRLTNGGTRAGIIITADRTATGSDTAGVWTSDAGNVEHEKAATNMLVLNA